MKTVPRALLVVMLLGLAACDAVLGIGEYQDRGARGPDATSADGDASDEASDGPGSDKDGGTRGPGKDGGKDGSVDAGQPGSIDFGKEPEGGPALSTLTCPVLAMPARAATVYVDAKATGAEAGTKTAPFHTIAKAFASAAQNGIVWVAAGTYQENLVVPDKTLLLQGGFAPGFGARTNACATILEAANASQPVLSADATVKGFAMEGLSVQKAARGMTLTGDESVVPPASFTIARCVFSDLGDPNVVAGAISLDRVNARIFGSVFRDNRAAKGAAISAYANEKLTIDQNLFDRNLGYADHGGGLYLSPKTAKIVRNTFRGNKTGLPSGSQGGWGGAVLVYEGIQYEATADFAFNVFTENLAYIGGALFVDDGASVTMSHDLIYRNRAYATNGTSRGAGLYIDGTGLGPAPPGKPGGGSTLIGEYLTVVNNVYDETGKVAASSFGGNIYVDSAPSKATFTNSIFWNNGADAFYVEAGSLITVSNSIGASACTTGSFNGFLPASATICKIGAGVFQPAAILFVDELVDDYHEKSSGGHYASAGWVVDAITSPAIDKADPAATVGDEPAPNGGRANIGVFGRTKEASKAPP